MVFVGGACGAEDQAAGPSATTSTVASAQPAAVSLDEVVLDTFDGGSLPLSEATTADTERLLDVIAPIDEPVYQRAATADWLAADDLVLGFVGGDGTARAYPHRILDLHELVTEVVDGQPVVITYCPLCRSGVVYDRRLDHPNHRGTLTFANSSALYQNDLVMIDHQTGSYWWQVAGRAIVGSLTGAELVVLPSRTARWGDWLADHPDSLVLADEQGFDRDYGLDRFVGYEAAVDQGRTPFPVDDAHFADDRLAPSTRIIGFEGPGFAVAVPAEGSPAVVEIERGGARFEVRRASGSAAVWQLRPGGADPYPSRSSFWYAYLAAFPEVEVVSG
ncbi:MAG: DUF3179 domain-containing protein [Acidimicrobiia bacterium]|nr:DUF3179 domain-containing protein [Acidimicrobiia bacterium]